MVDWIADSSGKGLVKPEYTCCRCGRAYSKQAWHEKGNRCSCKESPRRRVNASTQTRVNPSVSNPSTKREYEAARRSQARRLKRARQSVWQRKLELFGKAVLTPLLLTGLVATVTGVLVYGYNERFYQSLWTAIAFVGAGCAMMGVLFVFFFIAEKCESNKRVAAVFEILGGACLLAIGMGLWTLSYHHDSSGWYAHYFNGVYQGTYYHTDRSNDVVAGIAVVIYFILSFGLIGSGISRFTRKTAVVSG